MNNQPTKPMKRIALLIAVALCGGCTITKYEEQGAKFSRAQFFTKQVFSDLSVNVSTNGSRTLTLKGYSNDGVAGAAAVTSAAVDAAVKAIKP